MKNYITVSKIGILLLCAGLMSACSNNNTTAQSEATSSELTLSQSGAATEVQLAGAKLSDLVTFDEDDSNTSWTADQSTDIALAGTSAVVEGAGAESKDGSVAIIAAGTYVLSGKLSDGQIVVNNQDDGIVHLVLNGVNITDSDSAAIYIKEAGKVIITLEDGTENSVSDGATYVYADDTTDEPSAAIFSKADLTINGTGKLSVSANYNDGITSKDDLKIMSGILEIQAADDGIVGKDLVAVQDGSISITAEGDGIKSTNDTETDKGFIGITAGTFDIQAGNDGIQAETALVIDGGTYTLVTGGGNENGEVKTGDPGAGMGMRGNRGQGTGGQAPGTTDTSTSEAKPETMPEASQQEASTTSTTAESETVSTKGLKAGGDISVNNGTFNIDSADDAVHSNSNIAIAAGEFNIKTGDDGIHADALVAISGGKIDITKSYEGIEGANIAMSGGEAHVVSSDDGVNVAGGNDEVTVGGGPQEQDQFSDAAANVLTISGGTLTVDATGDGLDSNGSIVMSGGTVIVNGPTNSGNGALDYDGSFEQSGGTLIAAGSSGMAQATSDTSSQHAVSMTFPQIQKAGALVHLEDSEGNTILTFAPSKDYQSLVMSSPDLKDGGSYTLYSGGTSTGSEANGLYTDGEYTGGTKVVTFEITSSVTWLNESGVTTANTNQGPGGGGGGKGRP
ncbi:carbohydrate-binding domain-containing protein [Paenibacillus sp. FSL K6-3166]|uniref:carbohydrate-binding domain-containing protein n=1 Tax=unclassified Paenibacillus TaxID=185978 RepID=UPI000B9FBB65|nr:carbohydrate-binding domain-containing protein [Paenibacillus sp. VTT E-133291]OZQ97979.1 dockerin type 1 [Paenibacillus sp. VTT E-133291]